MEDNRDNSPQKEEVENISMRVAFTRGRLGGWPAIISIAGLFSILFRMLFVDAEAYMIIGQYDVYDWEILLFFLVSVVSFLPVAFMEAKRLVTGLPPLPAAVYWKKVIIYFLFSAAISWLIRSLIYPFMFIEFR